MADINEIVELSKEYLVAFEKQKTRLALWSSGGAFETIRDTLQKISKQIIQNNVFFKSHLYVIDESRSESKSGIYLKAGQLSIPTSNEITEMGFEIHFVPLYNGTIHVYAKEHSIEKEPKSHTLELIDDITTITEQKVIDMVYSGLRIVYKSSYLFEKINNQESVEDEDYDTQE